MLLRRHRLHVSLLATATARRAGHRVRMARLGSVRLTSPAPGVAEAVAVVRDDERGRAVALRVEWTAGVPRVVALDLG
jgi:hypothetical protein